MSSWKAKKLRKFPQEKVLLELLKEVDQQYPPVLWTVPDEALLE
jgi:hypothetical protein